MINPYTDEYFMKEAYRLALKAGDDGEIPVGAVIVAGHRIIGKGYNQSEKLNDSTAHAEMIALTSAFHYLGAKYLPECRLYVTLEPCVMCAGAIHWAQIDTIVYGAKDPKKGYSLYSDPKGKSIIPLKVKVKSGVMAKECSLIVEKFFREIRKKQ